MDIRQIHRQVERQIDYINRQMDRQTVSDDSQIVSHILVQSYYLNKIIVTIPTKRPLDSKMPGNRHESLSIYLCPQLSIQPSICLYLYLLGPDKSRDNLPMQQLRCKFFAEKKLYAAKTACVIGSSIVFFCHSKIISISKVYISAISFI